MGREAWSLTAKPCDSCEAAAATVFCRTDSAFLCINCDGRVHAADNLSSRHPRVGVCEVCEHAPAAFTCKADAAALCATCDADIHSANPLARRHERLPVVHFYDSASATRPSHSSEEFSEEEAEAASWLLPDPNSKPDAASGSTEYKSSDGVVPVQYCGSDQDPDPVVDGFPACDVDYPGSKSFMYNFTSQSISQIVSSSSIEVVVVPDHNAMADASKNEAIPTRLLGMDREARVLKYREKRKNRKFEKTIRYASRKAYAETRPRIKGRFAKRSELQVDPLIAADASFGVVPTF